MMHDATIMPHVHHKAFASYVSYVHRRIRRCAQKLIQQKPLLRQQEMLHRLDNETSTSMQSLAAGKQAASHNPCMPGSERTQSCTGCDKHVHQPCIASSELDAKPCAAVLRNDAVYHMQCGLQ
jgi:hypothetical protein